jgi:hypothetical protein
MKFLVVVLACASLGACATANRGEDSPRASHEIVSGAGRVHGGGLRMDVAVGHTFAQRPARNASASTRLTSASPVVP